MNGRVNLEALQSYHTENQAIDLVDISLHESLNQSELCSFNFEVDRLEFGTSAPSMDI
jgi:hypothetical protein